MTADEIKKLETHFIDLREKTSLLEHRIKVAEGQAQNLCARLEISNIALRESLRLLGVALQKL